MEETTKTLKLFGGEVTIQLDAEQPLAEQLIEETYRLGLRLQKVFNFYDPKSELSRLNQRKSLRVSKELLHVIELALPLCRQTDGNYDISLGKKILARKKGEEIVVGCSYRDIAISGGTITLKHPDAQIDLGSVAKGYIADRMAEYLVSQGVLSGLIDARGDIRVFGKKQRIGILHPRKKTVFGFVEVDSAVATSGDYNQFHKAYESNHILNQKNLASVTVIADDLATADAFATMLFVSGEEKRNELLQKNKLPALTIDTEMRIEKYNGFRLLQ